MKLSLPRRISTGLRAIINYLGGMSFTKLSQPAASLLVSRSWRTAKDTRTHQEKSTAKNPAQLWTDGKRERRNQKTKEMSGESRHALWRFALGIYTMYIYCLQYNNTCAQSLQRQSPNKLKEIFKKGQTCSPEEPFLGSCSSWGWLTSFTDIGVLH